MPPAARLAFPAAGAALLLLGGCGYVPRPFEHAEPNPLLWPGARAGIVVGPVEGSAYPRTLAVALAQALRRADVAAMTEGSAAAFRLEGFVAPGADEILWQVRDPAGNPAGGHVQRIERGAADDLRRLPDIAGAAASPLARLMRNEAPVPASRARSGTAPVVSVRPVRGAPGDGATSLTGAMAKALERIGLRVADERPDFILRGEVVARPAAPGYRNVEVVWTLADPSGEEVGSARQASPVHADAVEGPWGPLADQVAQAGASGVAEIVRQAGGGRAGASPFTGR